MRAPRTHFARYSHGHLYQMLHQGEEASVRSAADVWDGVGGRLHEQAGKLETRLTAFRERWQGGAAEQYQLMITDLGAGLRRIGSAMFAMRDIAHDTADALTSAKAAMPAPTSTPELSPLTAFLATTPIEVDPLASTQDVAALRQRQSAAAAELTDYQEAVRASDSAHARAVAVMNTLAVQYLDADEAIPVAPRAERPDGVSVGDEGRTRWELARDEEPADEQAAGPPVFGHLFTAGVAAAAAAATGRLGTRLAPKVPGWAKKDRTDRTGKAKPDKATRPTGRPPAARGGGGFVGGGGFGGGAGVGGPGPVAHAGMVGPAAGAAAAAGGLRAAAGAAGAGMSMPFMPFMPFAPPMGAGGANARRVPPWLTETEDVWGESVVIAPPVLGEDPPDERRPTEFPY